MGRIARLFYTTIQEKKDIFLWKIPFRLYLGIRNIVWEDRLLLLEDHLVEERQYF